MAAVAYKKTMQDRFWDGFWRVHPKLYKWTNGRIGGRLVGLPALLLTTTGRKSGEARTAALTFVPREKDFVVIASKLGRPSHPAWVLNLVAKPEASVQLMAEHIAVRARVAQGGERAELWSKATEKVPQYDGYAEKTKGIREIPVVVLERVSP